jgi:hypothetical protein
MAPPFLYLIVLPLNQPQTDENAMSKSLFETLTILLGLAFTLAFFVIVVPALLVDGDIVGAFAAGFVNPYSSGYSLDVIITGLILIVWILYERQSLGVRYGWVCIVLCAVPGVATAFALYLVLRSRTVQNLT